MFIFDRGCRGHDRMVVGYTTTLPVHIATKIVSSNPVHGEVYSLSVTCGRSVIFSGYSGFLRHDITEILLKVALNIIKQPTKLSRDADFMNHVIYFLAMKLRRNRNLFEILRNT